ncbi:hypothetical protein R3P38DRAFT_3190859 [Favolaschia claudopus]|uniref:Uncharacterized protein n=1 Tax=Favolaschia claudopus TaxID=2862362 RepID=A0AAW0BMP2_9AGAR
MSSLATELAQFPASPLKDKILSLVVAYMAAYPDGELKNDPVAPEHRRAIKDAHIALYPFYPTQPRKPKPTAAKTKPEPEPVAGSSRAGVQSNEPIASTSKAEKRTFSSAFLTEEAEMFENEEREYQRLPNLGESTISKSGKEKEIIEISDGEVEPPVRRRKAKAKAVNAGNPAEIIEIFDD